MTESLTLINYLRYNVAILITAGIILFLPQEHLDRYFQINSDFMKSYSSIIGIVFISFGILTIINIIIHYCHRRSSITSKSF